MSDEQNPSLTGDVHELVPQKHGGALKNPRVDRRRVDVTPGMTRARSRRAFFLRIPELERIGRNKVRSTKKKGDGEAATPAKAKRPYKVSDQLRAIDILGKYGNDDRISAADLRDACRGMAEDIRGFLPPDQADALLAIVARRFVYL